MTVIHVSGVKKIKENLLWSLLHKINKARLHQNHQLKSNIHYSISNLNIVDKEEQSLYLGFLLLEWNLKALLHCICISSRRSHHQTPNPWFVFKCQYVSELEVFLYSDTSYFPQMFSSSQLPPLLGFSYYIQTVFKWSFEVNIEVQKYLVKRWNKIRFKNM